MNILQPAKLYPFFKLHWWNKAICNSIFISTPQGMPEKRSSPAFPSSWQSCMKIKSVPHLPRASSAYFQNFKHALWFFPYQRTAKKYKLDCFWRNMQLYPDPLSIRHNPWTDGTVSFSKRLFQPADPQKNRDDLFGISSKHPSGTGKTSSDWNRINNIRNLRTGRLP